MVHYITERLISILENTSFKSSELLIFDVIDWLREKCEYHVVIDRQAGKDGWVYSPRVYNEIGKLVEFDSYIGLFSDYYEALETILYETVKYIINKPRKNKC